MPTPEDRKQQSSFDRAEIKVRITRKMQLRTGYNIPDDIKAKFIKKTETFRNEIERYAKPDADMIYLEPKRGLSLDTMEP